MNKRSEPIGPYRTGSELEAFLGDAGVEVRIGSRVPSARMALRRPNTESGGRDRLARLMGSVADPRLYLDEPEKEKAVVGYLYRRLRFDDRELRKAEHVNLAPSRRFRLGRRRASS